MYGVDGLEEAVDLPGGRRRPEGYARGGADAEGGVDRLGAVVPGAHGHAGGVEHLSDVVGVDPLDAEGDDPEPVGGVRGAQDPHPRHRGEPVQGAAGERPLPRVQAVQSQAGEVVGGGDPAGGLGRTPFY